VQLPTTIDRLQSGVETMRQRAAAFDVAWRVVMRDFDRSRRRCRDVLMLVVVLHILQNTSQ
jgi:hypothetical protein